VTNEAGSTEVRIYPNPEKWNERISKVPGPLRQKALSQLDAAYKEQGFKPRANGQDANGSFYDVDIRPGTELAQVYEFLQSVDAAAVTMEPSDVEKIYGKSAGTLGLRRSIEINGAAASGLELIEPDNLADAFSHAGSQGIAWDGFVADDAAAEKFIADDLVHNGLLSEADAKATDEWVEAPEPMGLRIGDHSDRYNGDMGEFQPDYEVEAEWGDDF
jgi:hypothetical protein